MPKRLLTYVHKLNKNKTKAWFRGLLHYPARKHIGHSTAPNPTRGS